MRRAIAGKVSTKGRAPRIRYVGAEAMRRYAPQFSLDAVHRVVMRAIERASSSWGWRPEDLVVGFFVNAKTMGLSIAPGHQERFGARVVLLNPKLFSHYDDEALEGTFLHELAHHYREETWPRARFTAASAHDEKFCAALVRAGVHEAKDRRACRFFGEVEDPARVLEAARAHGVTYSPESGVVYVERLKTRSSFWWVSSNRRKERIVASDSSLASFVRRFEPNTLSSVKLIYGGKYPTPERDRERTLHDLIVRLLRINHGKLPLLAEALRDNEKPAAKKTTKKPAAKKTTKKPAAKKTTKKPAAKKTTKKPAARRR